MKHPKRINLAMKKLITANRLNPKDYWFLKNTIDSLVIIHKETSKVITLKKCENSAFYDIQCPRLNF